MKSWQNFMFISWLIHIVTCVTFISWHDSIVSCQNLSWKKFHIYIDTWNRDKMSCLLSWLIHFVTCVTFISWHDSFVLWQNVSRQNVVFISTHEIVTKCHVYVVTWNRDKMSCVYRDSFISWHDSFILRQNLLWQNVIFISTHTIVTKCHVYIVTHLFRDMCHIYIVTWLIYVVTKLIVKMYRDKMSYLYRQMKSWQNFMFISWLIYFVTCVTFISWHDSSVSCQNLSWKFFIFISTHEIATKCHVYYRDWFISWHV